MVKMKKRLDLTLILPMFIILTFFSLSARANDLVFHLSMNGNSKAEALMDNSGKNIKAATNGNPKWKSNGGYDGT